MSPIDYSTQFFPAHLKWVSIIFFAIIGCIAVAIALTSPQSLNNEFKTQQSDSNHPQDSLSPTQTQVKSATTSAAPLPESASLQSQSHSISIVDETESMQPDTSHEIHTETPPISPPAPPEKEHAKSCKNPLIKGVITADGSKIYYSKGNQRYFSIDKWAKLARMFCTESEAQAAGWHQATR